MFDSNSSVSSDASSTPDTSAAKVSFRKFRKRLYITIAGIIAIVVIVVAVLIPQGSAIITLEVNYLVGEKMVYDTTVTATFQVYNTTLASRPMAQSPDNTSVSSKQTIEIIDFDGEYYTLNHTTAMALTQKTFSFSYLEKMNKTGYSTYVFNLGTQQITTNMSGSPNLYLTGLLNKSEVKVGETWHVPLPTGSSSIEMNGDLIMTFRGFEVLTVPAGTYKVFRVDITSNNLNMHFNPSGNNLTINLASNMNIDMNGRIYMEYGTLRQIKSTTQETASYQSATMNYTMNLYMEMTLAQHIKP